MDRINKESQTYFQTTRMLNFTEIYSLHSLFTQRVCHVDDARLLDANLVELHDIAYFSNDGTQKDQICKAKYSSTS